MAFNREKALTAAAKFASKGQHDRAAKEYVSIIEADPTDVRSWLLLAEALVNAGDKAGALERYLHVGKHYAEAGDAQKAIAVFRKVLGLDPNRLDIQTAIAGLYKDLGRTADAVAAYEFVAQAYFQAGQIAEGLEGFRMVAELEPAAVGKRLRLAELYSREGMVAQAVEHFRLAAERLFADRRTDDYIRVAERLIYHKEDDLPVLRSLAQIYLKQGENRRALVKLNALLRAAPADAEGLELLGETFVAIGKIDKAISVVMELAREQRKGGRKAKETAARVLRKALGWNPENAEDIKKTAGEIEAEIAALPPEPTDAPEPRDDDMHLDVDVVEDDAGGGDIDLDVDVDEDEEHKVEEVPSRPFAPVDANVASSVVEAGEDSVGDVEKVLLEARVYVKYKMFEHALGHLDAVFVREANHVAALELQAQILVELARNTDAADAYVRLAQLASGRDPKLAHEHIARAQALVPDHTKAEMVLAALDSGDGGSAEPAPLIRGLQGSLSGDPESEARTFDPGQSSSRNAVVEPEAVATAERALAQVDPPEAAAAAPANHPPADVAASDAPADVAASDAPADVAASDAPANDAGIVETKASEPTKAPVTSEAPVPTPEAPVTSEAPVPTPEASVPPEADQPGIVAESEKATAEPADETSGANKPVTESSGARPLLRRETSRPLARGEGSGARRLPTEGPTEGSGARRLPTEVITESSGARRLPTEVITEGSGARRLPTEGSGSRRLPTEVITEGSGARRLPTEGSGARRLPTEVITEGSGARRLPTEGSGARRLPTELTPLPISSLLGKSGDKTPQPSRFNEKTPLPTFKPPPPAKPSDDQEPTTATEQSGEQAQPAPSDVVPESPRPSVGPPKPTRKPPGAAFRVPARPAPAQPSPEVEELDADAEVEELDVDEVAEVVEAAPKPPPQKGPPSRPGPPARKPPAKAPPRAKPPSKPAAPPPRDLAPADSAPALETSTKPHADEPAVTTSDAATTASLTETSAAREVQAPGQTEATHAAAARDQQTTPDLATPRETATDESTSARTDAPANVADAPATVADVTGPDVAAAQSEATEPTTPEPTAAIAEAATSSADTADAKSGTIADASTQSEVTAEASAPAAEVRTLEVTAEWTAARARAPEQSEVTEASAPAVIAESPAQSEVTESPAQSEVAESPATLSESPAQPEISAGSPAAATETPAQPEHAETPELAALEVTETPAPQPGAGPNASWPDITDEVDELRFFISGRFEDDAQFAYLELQRRFPGHPQLAEFAERFVTGARIESAAAPVMLEDAALAVTPVVGAAPVIAFPLEDEDEDSFLASIFDEPVVVRGGGKVAPRRAVASLDDGADAQTFFDLGTAYREMGLIDDALTQFDLAARDTRWTSRARVMMSNLRVGRGENDQALADLQTAIDSATDQDEQSEARYELGVLYQALGDTERAIAALQVVAAGYRDRDERLAALGG